MSTAPDSAASPKIYFKPTQQVLSVFEQCSKCENHDLAAGPRGKPYQWLRNSMRFFIDSPGKVSTSHESLWICSGAE